MRLKPTWEMLREAAADWSDDKAPRLGAALALPRSHFPVWPWGLATSFDSGDPF
jgi:hypothetical protein